MDITNPIFKQKMEWELNYPLKLKEVIALMVMKQQHSHFISYASKNTRSNQTTLSFDDYSNSINDSMSSYHLNSVYKISNRATVRIWNDNNKSLNLKTSFLKDNSIDNELEIIFLDYFYCDLDDISRNIKFQNARIVFKNKINLNTKSLNLNKTIQMYEYFQNNFIKIIPFFKLLNTHYHNSNINNINNSLNNIYKTNCMLDDIVDFSNIKINREIQHWMGSFLNKMKKNNINSIKTADIDIEITKSPEKETEFMISLFGFKILTINNVNHFKYTSNNLSVKFICRYIERKNLKEKLSALLNKARFKKL